MITKISLISNEEEVAKPKSSVWDMFEQPTEATIPTQSGIGASAVGGATEDTSLHLTRNPYLVKINELKSKLSESGTTLDNYDNALTELDKQFKVNPTQELANQYNSILNKRQSLFKEYEVEGSQFNNLIDEYNKTVKTKNEQIDVKYKHAFKRYKQETGLPSTQPSYYTPLPEPEKPEVPSSQYGISDLNKPEQMGKIQKGVISAFGTWEAKKKANPELQKMEDFGSEILGEANKWAEELKGEDWEQSGSSPEQVAIIYERITGESKEEALTDIKSQKDLNIFFVNPPEKYKEAVKLHRQLEDIFMRKAEPGKDLIGQLGWSGMVAIMGTQTVAGLMDITPKIWKKLTIKVTDKKISFKEGLDAILKTGHGEGTAYQRKIFNEAVKQADTNNISVTNMLKKGLTITDIRPRFAFGTKLYAGLPADEIVKSLVEVGKVSAEAVKGLDPVKVSQVTQALLNINPALASEFLKAVEKPEAIPKKGLSKLPALEQLEATIKGEKPLFETHTASPTYEEEIKKAKEAGLKFKYHKEEPYVRDEKTGEVLATAQDVIIYKPENEAQAIELFNLGENFRNTPEYHRKVGELLGYSKEEIDEFIGSKSDIGDIKEGVEGVDYVKEAPKALEPLAEEARKYGSVEEFVEAQGEKNRLYEQAQGFNNEEDFIAHYRGSATQYNKYTPGLRKFGTTEDSQRISELGIDPNKKITIYRGIDDIGSKYKNAKINDGDFVTTDYDSAKSYTGGEVISKEVMAKDLITDFPDEFDLKDPFYVGAEFIYSKSSNKLIKYTDSELENIFKEAKSSVSIANNKKALKEINKILSYQGEFGFTPVGNELVNKIETQIKSNYPKDYFTGSNYDKLGELIKQELIRESEKLKPKTKQQLTSIYNQATAKPEGEGEYLYHGTSEGAFRNIREEGITGDKEKYFANTEEYAETYAKRKSSDRVLRVKKTPDFVEDKNIPEGGDFKTLENIPPENIEIKVGDKWIPIQEYTDINKNIMPIKPTTTAPKAEVKGEAVKALKTYDLNKDVPSSQKLEGNKLMGQIYKIVNNKGLTKVEFTALKRKYGLSPHLATATRRMTIPQLQAVLKAVEKARPKVIGYRKVIKPKTEKKIQSLKENLIDKLQMTEEAYQAVLKDVGVYKEPKYTDAKNFITETQGKDIIYRLIDEANILKITMPYEKAVNENDVIKGEVDKLDRRIKSEGDRRLKDPHELNSMRLYIQKMETIAGEPIYPLYQDLIDAHLENKEKLGKFIKGFEPYKEIIKDEKELKKVNDYILAKSNLKSKPEVPANMTDKEIKLANKIQDILKTYEAKARTEKFLDSIDHPEDIPQYQEFKKEIDEAKDIYESKGYDDLIEYMKGQKWGIIRSGYSPLQVLTPKIRLYKPKPTTYGKGHIKVRKDIEYHEQDRNIIQRLFSYKKQMDNLVVMRPKVRALITQVEKNLSKFKDPNRITKVMEAFFRELKGYNRAENWFDRGLNRIYAQAMQTIIMPSLVLSGRNLLQNIAFGHDKSMLIDPRNKALTADEEDYLHTYISQMESMKADWLMVGEKPLPGLATLTKIVQKIGIYPYSDLANRHWGFWGKVNQIKRAFAGDKSLDKKMKGAKFSDMEAIEQKRALQILAKDGVEAMTRYVARIYVDNTQFLYDRSQRSPAEMGRVGRWAGNLMLFPRAYWEMLLKQGKKFTGKSIPFRERSRAFKVIANIIGGGILVGVAYKKVTGRRQNPYDPLTLLAYEPGGLAIGTAQAVTDVYTNILMASKGDDRALAALTTAIPQAADMFIPFYAYFIRALEASTDTKNIDRMALRKLRMMIDKEYELRGDAYILERKAMEKWQYFLSGAGIDVEIKEREAEKKAITIGKPSISKISIPKISKIKISKISPIKSKF